MLSALKITYKFFVLQRKIQKNIIDNVRFQPEGVQALNDMIERLSKI